MDRTGVGTLALFGRHMRYDVSKTFPVLTTRKDLLEDRYSRKCSGCCREARTFVDLLEQGVHIWTDWPLAKYREKTGEEISKEPSSKHESSAMTEFAEEHGSIGRNIPSPVEGLVVSDGGRKASTRYKSWSIRSSRIPPADGFSGKDGTSQNST